MKTSRRGIPPRPGALGYSQDGLIITSTDKRGFTGEVSTGRPDTQHLRVCQVGSSICRRWSLPSALSASTSSTKNRLPFSPEMVGAAAGPPLKQHCDGMQWRVAKRHFLHLRCAHDILQNGTCVAHSMTVVLSNRVNSDDHVACPCV